MAGSANDPLEREADHVAAQVTAMPALTSGAGTNPLIQPFSSSSASELLPASGFAAIHSALAGSGTPLSPTLKQDMERRFGCDFSRVRIYSDSEEGQSAIELSAQAYTAGHKLVFAPGRFEPTTSHGLRLLCHELTHVVQQAGGSARADVREQRPRAVQRQSNPDIELARKLAAKLKAGKRDDALAEIEALPQSDRDRLEVAMTQAFAMDKPMSDDLRRIIRFVRHKPVIGPSVVLPPREVLCQRGQQ